jgi:hypothetical protein
MIPADLTVRLVDLPGTSPVSTGIWRMSAELRRTGRRELFDLTCRDRFPRGWLVREFPDHLRQAVESDCMLSREMQRRVSERSSVKDEREHHHGDNLASLRTRIRQ